MWMWVRTSGRSETLPQVDCHLLFAVERRSARLKGTDHLLDDLLKEQAGQLRVQERLKLKGHLRTTWEGARVSAPSSFLFFDYN